MAARTLARFVQRRLLSSGGKVLSEEEKTAENVYIKKMEQEKLEKLARKGPSSGEQASSAADSRPKLLLGNGFGIFSSASVTGGWHRSFKANLNVKNYLPRHFFSSGGAPPSTGEEAAAAAVLFHDGKEYHGELDNYSDDVVLDYEAPRPRDFFISLPCGAFSRARQYSDCVQIKVASPVLMGKGIVSKLEVMMDTDNYDFDVLILLMEEESDTEKLEKMKSEVESLYVKLQMLQKVPGFEIEEDKNESHGEERKLIFFSGALYDMERISSEILGSVVVITVAKINEDEDDEEDDDEDDE